MNVPLLDLGPQHEKLTGEFRSAFEKVLASGKFILGPEVELFEKEIAAACQSRHAISCASGSDALLLSLMALDVGPGDEVITSPYSFFATASCIARLGAEAVFADINLCCYNLDAREVLKKITPRTKAIIPVHLYGQSAEMEPYLAIAADKKIGIVEDAAQAIGAEYEGQPIGALGHIGCLSFFPTKNLGGLGDGGMLLTNDDKLAERLRILRVHGAHPKYYHQQLGINSRLDTLQAAFLRVKLPHLPHWTDGRRKNSLYYIEKLVEVGLAAQPNDGHHGHVSKSKDKPLILPCRCQSSHVYNQFVIRLRNPDVRDPLRKHLETAGIGSEIYYPLSLHLQECFAIWGYGKGDFPNSELASASTIALPIFPELTNEQLDAVVKALISFKWSSYA
jgi:dTDP-4-amino-4,6-dideoxygalactose transaminase